MPNNDWASQNLSMDEVIRRIDEQILLGEQNPNPPVSIDHWAAQFITNYQNAHTPLPSELFLEWFAGSLDMNREQP